MAGLNLGASARASGYLGPAGLPVAANMPTGTTINQQAFGIRNGSEGCGPRTAGMGTTGIALGAAAVLVWLWWTLPR